MSGRHRPCLASTVVCVQGGYRSRILNFVISAYLFCCSVLFSWTALLVRADRAVPFTNLIGAVYNGAGQFNAQSNQMVQGGGAAAGNAPAWFPGEAGAHAHPAVLSGLKSQALKDSQKGTGAYSQLVFDDTPQ